MRRNKIILMSIGITFAFYCLSFSLYGAPLDDRLGEFSHAVQELKDANNQSSPKPKKITPPILGVLSSQDLDNLKNSPVTLPGEALSHSLLKKGHFVNAQLNGVDFTGALLNESNFEGATLEYSNFSNAHLMKVNFNSIQGQSVNFSGAHVFEASFRNAVLRRVNFKNTDLRFVKHFDSADLTGSIYNLFTRFPEEFNPTDKHMVLDLENEDLHGYPLQGYNFQNINLKNVDFRHADLRGAQFQGAELEGVNFDYANLTHANFEGSHLDKTRFQNAILVQANFTGQDMRLIDFKGSDLRAINFSKANLSGMNLTDISLAGANFTDANLNLTYFDRSDLQGATLNRADIGSAFFKSSNLSGVNIMRARNYHLASYDLAITSSSTILPHKQDIDREISNALSKSRTGRNSPETQQQIEKNIIADWIKFRENIRSISHNTDEKQNSGGTRTYGNFKGKDLAGYSFYGTNLSQSDFRGADLRQAHFFPEIARDAKYDAETQFPEGIDPVALGMVFYVGENKSSPNLNPLPELQTKSNPESRTYKSPCKSWTLFSIPAPSVRPNFKFKPSASVVETISFELSNGQSYACYDFRNINFSDTKLSDFVFTGSKFQNAIIGKKYISGQMNSFHHINRADFSYADLRGVTFINVNIEHVKFHGADLRGADFTDAQMFRKHNFQGAIWDKTTKFPAYFPPDRWK
jgi:uncharacterized protein YjbI with pentapeptide repeats